MKQVQPLDADDWRNGGFGLYVHWPFCASKCPYCDFNSHVSANIDHSKWVKAYVREIERVALLTPDRTLDTIFFGGGTPSTMDPDTVGAIIDAARKAWPTRNTLEITLEANPASVDFEKFSDFSGAGVNRVSLGLQALNDESLRLLGRLHSVNEALQAWDVANKVFERTSFDLIYARQHQELPDWKRELQNSLALGPKHLSLYQLTIEDGTAFGDRYRLGRLPGLPDDDTGADLYDTTQDICEAAGLPAYEVSNHAECGDESRHNLIYWRYGDYVGVGPGAHGRLTIDGRKIATDAERMPQKWLASVLSGSGIHEVTETVGNLDQATEYLLMSLRLTEGANMDRWLRLARLSAPPDSLQPLLDDGFLWKNESRFGTTLRGRKVLNSVLRTLL